METAAAERPRLVYLPNTCPENRKHHTHLKLLTSVDPLAEHNLGFEGRVLWPGTRLAETEISPRSVVLEYAGPQGQWKRGKQRPHLYILWRYDPERRDWIEIAQAQAIDWSWAVVLRGPAVAALSCPISADNSIERGREVADELLTAIDSALMPEQPEARMVALTALYDQVAGRIARATAII